MRVTRFGTQADESDFAPVRRPGRRFRSHSRKPADTAAISVHRIYFTFTFPVAGKEYSSVGWPIRRHVNPGIECQSGFIASVSIHHIDLGIPVCPAHERYPFAVARPCWLTIVRLRVRYLCGRASISIHNVNVMHARAIARKRNLASVGRPVGIEIIGRIIGKLSQFAVNTHNRYLEVPVSVSLKNKLRAVGRPRGPPVIRQVVGHTFEIASLSIHNKYLLFALNGPDKSDVVSVRWPGSRAVAFIIIRGQVTLARSISVRLVHVKVTVPAADEKDLLTIGWPPRLRIILRVIHYSPDIRAIGIHHVDIKIIKTGVITVARKSNLATVRRPWGTTISRSVSG